jgi:CheY-like chemotaxis protein
VAASTTSGGLVRTIRMEDGKLVTLLERLDAAGETAKAKRSSERFSYRVRGCVAHMQQPGAAGSTPYQVATRDISATGMAFLHGGYVHIGTRCLIQLITAHGTWDEIRATVVRCGFVEGNVHEVGVKFDNPIEPGDYCSSAVKPRVLLAEDDPSLAKLGTFCLRRLNAEVEVAENGQVAVDKALNNIYDVVFMDVDMPVLDGLAATRQLREKGYSGLIVALTAGTQPEDREKCLSAGCDRFMSKPITQGLLFEVIESLKDEPLVSKFHNDDAMTELVDEYVNSIPAKLRAIEDAFAHSDTKLVETLARGFKAEGASYGFDPISEIAVELETAAMDQKPQSEIKKQLDELIKLCMLARGSTHSTTGA